MTRTVYQYPDGSQLLIEDGDEPVTIAKRARSWETWGPPVVVEVKIREEELDL